MAKRGGDFKASVYTRLTLLTKTRFEKLKVAVDQLQAQAHPLSAVQLKQLNAYSNELRKKKAEFEGQLQKALILPDDDAIEDEVLSQDQDMINDLFGYISAVIEVLTPPEEPKTPSATSEISTADVAAFSQVRLPKLDLQKFSGDPLTWTSFINLFDTTIHRNASLSGVMKFQYLLSVLSSEPLNLVKSLNLTAANYLVAYNLLRDRYHNTRRLQSLHLNQLLDLPSITASYLKGLRHFLNLFTEHSQALKALDCDITVSNPLLAALLLRKMDATLRKSLEGFRFATDDDPGAHSLPAVSDIIKFLNTECTRTEDANIHKAPHLPKTDHKSNVPPKAFASKRVHFDSRDVAMVTTHTGTNKVPSTSTSNNQSRQCFACQQHGHNIYSCNLFKNKTPHERYQLVKKHHRCISCLGNHEVKDCKSQATCRTCSKQHHSLLHFQTSHDDRSVPQSSSRVAPRQPSPQTRSKDVKQALSVTMSQSQGAERYTVLLGTALVNLKASDGTAHVFRALLDSGSMCDLITEHAAQLLGVRRHKSMVQLTGLSQSTAKTKGQTYLDVETLSGLTIASQHPMLILDTLTVDLPRAPISTRVLKKTQAYVLADPTFHLPGRIDIVLGGSLYPKLFTNEQFSLGPNMPQLFGTHFGYVVMGSAPCTFPSSNEHTALCSTHLNVSLHSASDADLHSSLQRFWSQEEPPVCNKKSVEEEICDASFQSTHTRDEEGRYIVRLPFKEAPPPLGASQLTAERRFNSLERKFAAQPRFSSLYHEFMDEYRSLDHMTKRHDLELPTHHYFLPHHGVLKESSNTTKLRTVFDASCKTSNGTSLNDILFTGRKLQTNICDVLSHFRGHNFVFSCDIRQMYRQIRIHPDDRDFQLILWRDSPEEPLSVYQLNTVTYGMNSSPYLAIKTLHQLADDEGHAFPAAAHVLKTHTYVDDIITGADTEEELLELQNQLVSLLRHGGFELRKWVSNSHRLLRTVPEEHLEGPVFLQEAQQPHFAILGLHWSPITDCFSYHLNFPLESRPTKRTVLSLIAQIYDPCGFLAPCLMTAKCFMQLLWTTGLQWDEPLPPDCVKQWHTFVTDARHLTKLSIPRTFHFSLSSSIEMHGFSDASEAGYAAVVYFRCQLSNGYVVVRPIMAKTRVSPLKRITLPRLELCAAHLLAQLVAHCQTLFKNRVPSTHTYLWCDSSVVLSWLRTPPYRLKTYVANRVSQTQELVPLDAWRHISSADNPADCASRGILASQLINHPLWWTGPAWLQLAHDNWPTTQFTPVDLTSSKEVKQTPLAVLTTTGREEWDLLSAYSSWDKLLRITALVLRFLHNCCVTDKHTGFLSLDELKQARLKIFSLVQQSTFLEEISSLKAQRSCTVRLQRLKPFIDPGGLLRVGGRLDHAHLSSDCRHPVLLPKTHHVVDLLVDHCHRTNLHAGPQLTQSILAQSVWILSARSVIRSRIFKCVTCFRNKPRNKSPIMGDLPHSRVNPGRPFLQSGIDYAGPFTVKIHNLKAIRHIKVYLCIFICMTTKATHIEVVTDLTTDAFIASLTRFVSRRGLCSDIYSDCGTNFVGADASLRKIVDSTSRSAEAQDKISHFSTSKGIKFHFNPPAAPHQGGLWESAVKGAKHHLRRVMGDTVLSLTQFITLATQVEAMLNSRPLTPLSTDPAEISALTPGHFLIGAPLASVPEPNLHKVPTNRLRQWQLVQALHQRIWQRWHLEYLHTLQQRSKWTQNHENLKVGDLVLVHAPSSPLNWPLARVIRLYPGADGIVRVVDLRTANGHLTRPAVKVFPLPLN